MSTRRKITNVVVLLVGLAIIGWLVYRFATHTERYTYRINCAAFPADDAALVDWLTAQPGVSGASVSREGDDLVVRFRVPWMQRGSRPDVVKTAEKLGYRIGKGYSFQMRRNWLWQR
jgi:hypothetical protein